jgi:hypothetical protein
MVEIVDTSSCNDNRGTDGTIQKLRLSTCWYTSCLWVHRFLQVTLASNRSAVSQPRLGADLGSEQDAQAGATVEWIGVYSEPRYLYHGDTDPSREITFEIRFDAASKAAFFKIPRPGWAEGQGATACISAGPADLNCQNLLHLSSKLVIYFPWCIIASTECCRQYEVANTNTSFEEWAKAEAPGPLILNRFH